MTLSTTIYHLHALKQQRDDEIVDLYTRQHWTLADIAEEAGMQRSSIARILKRNNIAVHGRGRPIYEDDNISG